MTTDDELYGQGEPVTFDVVSKAAHGARRPMDNLSVRMAVLQSLHGTHHANMDETRRALWHYGSRAIAGDY